MANAISDIRPANRLQSGDLIVTNVYGDLAFVCWVDGDTIAYRDADGGDYHERTARTQYVVFLEHPAIGANRTLEATCASWGEV